VKQGFENDSLKTHDVSVPRMCSLYKGTSC
jgi:hypothetical protein